MADNEADFRLDLTAPGAREELAKVAVSLGMVVREMKDTEREAERTKGLMTQFGREFQRTAQWVEKATTEQERFARMMTTVARSADASGLKEYTQALEYMDRHLGEVYRSGMKANEVMEALQRHAGRRGEIGIASNIGGIRGWMDELKPLAAELERQPARISAAWGRTAGAVQVAVGNVMAAMAQAAAQAAKQAVLSGAQLAIQRESLEATLTSMLGGSEQMVAAMAKITEASNKPGLTMQLAADSVMQLVQAGLSLDEAIETVIEFGNAVAYVGRGEEAVRGSLQQFNQMLLTQRITWEDWQPLITQGGPAFTAALERAFGTRSIQTVAEMGLTFEEFARRLLAAMKDGERASDLTANAISNLRSKWDEAKTQFGKGLLGDEATGEANDLADAVEELTPELRKLGGALNDLVIPRLRLMTGLLKEATGDTKSWTEKLSGLLSALGKLPAMMLPRGVLEWIVGPEDETGSAATTGASSVLPSPSVGMGGGRSRGGGASREFGPADPKPSAAKAKAVMQGDTAPLDPAELKAREDEKKIADRDAWISKLQVAIDVKQQSGKDMPGFKGKSVNDLQAALFKAKEVQSQAKGDTAGVWQAQQEAREAGIAKRRQELEVSKAMLQTDLEQLELTQQESVARRRSATEQLAHLESIRKAKKALIEVEYELTALTAEPGMEAARGKQKAVDLAGVDVAHAADRQTVVKSGQENEEQYLRGKVEQAKALQDLSRVERGHGDTARQTARALLELEHFYVSTGDAIEYMRVRAERLRFEQANGVSSGGGGGGGGAGGGTIAEQILAAGPGAGSISAMLKQRHGVTAHDLGAPGRGISQQQATIDPSAFKSRHFRGDAPGGVADQAADKAIAAGGGRFVNQVAAAAELAAGRILDQVVDGLGRVT